MNTKAINKLYDIVRDNIRHERLDKDMSQAELAEKCGLYPVQISSLETGRVKKVQLWMLYAFAKALDVPVTRFLPDPRKKK